MHMYFLCQISLPNLYFFQIPTPALPHDPQNNLILHWPPHLLLLRVHHFYHIIILHVSLLGSACVTLLFSHFSFQSFSALLSYSCSCINFPPPFLPVPTAIYSLAGFIPEHDLLGFPQFGLRCHIKFYVATSNGAQKNRPKDKYYLKPSEKPCENSAIPNWWPPHLKNNTGAPCARISQLTGVSRDLSSNSRCGTWFQWPEFNKNGPKEQVRRVDPWTTWW